MPKKRRERRENCYLCGRSDNLTRDHIPPACLFPEPRPSDLITVPACHRCHDSYKLDDEYFRIFAAAGAPYDDPVGREIWDDKVMGSSLARSQKLRQYIRSCLIDVEIRSPGGLYVGVAPGLTFDKERVDRVIQRIVRGLFHHHYRSRLPADLEFLVLVDPKGKRAFPDVLAQAPKCRIGDGVFAYARKIGKEDPRYSMWWFLFYRSRLLIVFAEPSEDVRTSDGSEHNRAS